MTLPFEGIRALDLTRALAGPYCTMMLGDLGADVIKVERPGRGDDSRSWGPPFAGGESAYFLCVNRNKRSIALDLRSESGTQVLRDLAAVSDMVVENFKTGSLEKLGVGYAELCQINPALIWVSLTGYGPSGPDAGRPGYDFMVQAEAGLMSLNGPADGDPARVGVPIVDITTGMFAAFAATAALRNREQTGQGQRVDLSLLETQLAWLANVGSNYLIGGQEPRRLGNAHPNIAPYATFRASDRPFALAAANQSQWDALCAAVGQEELREHPHFATNADRTANLTELTETLEEAFASRPAAEWVRDLRAAGLPCALVNTVPEAFNLPQALAREMVLEVNHPTAGAIKLAGFPYKLSATPAVIRRPPPQLGEHTEEILTELLCYSRERAQRLAEQP
jgi:formyl-CoA transferase